MDEKLTGQENLVELRSLALLDDLVKARSRKGAAEALDFDLRTLAANVDRGKLTTQVRYAVGRDCWQHGCHWRDQPPPRRMPSRSSRNRV